MASVLASGYHGPPELTPLRALTEWTADPWVLAAVLAAAGLYLAGARRNPPGGRGVAAGRAVAFCAGGAGLAGIAGCSFLAVYWPVLFYVRAIQTVVLLLAVPLFVALGRPLTLAIATLPRLGGRIEAAVNGQLARLLTFPAITAMVLVLTPFLLYFTPWYADGLHSTVVRELTFLVLPLPGLVFFWTLLRVDPVPRQYPYLVSLWVTGAEVVGDAVLGLAVIADRSLIAGGYYHAIARPWGPSPASDQVLGGGALWILGDLIGLPFLAAVLIAMMREDEAQARVIDAELDASDAISLPSADAPAAGSAHLADGSLAAGPAGVRPESGRRPWWESDPRFASRFAPVDQGQPGRRLRREDPSNSA